MIAPNVTELERQIATLQSQLSEAANEHARYLSACDEGLVGIFEWRPKENSVFVSPNLQNILAPGEGLPPDPYDWLSFVFHNDKGNLCCEIERCLTVPCSPLIRHCRDVRARVWVLVTKTGDKRAFLFRWRVICDAAFAVELVQGIAIDLTDDLYQINQDHFTEIPF